MKKSDNFMARELDTLREANKNRVVELSREGVVLHPINILQAHLTVLVEHFELDLQLEEEIALLLDAAQAEVERTKLTAGLGHHQLSIADMRPGGTPRP